MATPAWGSMRKPRYRRMLARDLAIRAPHRKPPIFPRARAGIKTSPSSGIRRLAKTAGVSSLEPIDERPADARRLYNRSRGRRSKHDLHGGSEQTTVREIVGKPDKLVNSLFHSPGLYQKTAPAA